MKLLADLKVARLHFPAFATREQPVIIIFSDIKH